MSKHVPEGREVFAATKIPVDKPPPPVRSEYIVERDEHGQPVRMVWVGPKPEKDEESP